MALSFGRPWLGDRHARRITSDRDIPGQRRSDSRLLEQPIEELFAGVYEGLHGRGEVSGVGGIHCGEIFIIGELIRFGEGFVRLRQTMPRQRGELSLHRDSPSVSSARMKGVLRHTGSAKTLRAMTRGEILTPVPGTEERLSQRVYASRGPVSPISPSGRRCRPYRARKAAVPTARAVVQRGSRASARGSSVDASSAR